MSELLKAIQQINARDVRSASPSNFGAVGMAMSPIASTVGRLRDAQQQNDNVYIPESIDGSSQQKALVDMMSAMNPVTQAIKLLGLFGR